MKRVFARFSVPLFFFVFFVLSFQTPWGFCGEIVNTVNSHPGVYPQIYPASIDLRPTGHDLTAFPLIVAARQPQYAEPDEDDFERAGSNRRVGLTPEEYKEFQELMVLKRPTPSDLALATFATRGAAFLLAAFAWMAVLLVLRYQLKELWDRDIAGNAYASAAVISVCVLTTGQILVAVLG